MQRSSLGASVVVLVGLSGCTVTDMTEEEDGTVTMRMNISTGRSAGWGGTRRAVRGRGPPLWSGPLPWCGPPLQRGPSPHYLHCAAIHPRRRPRRLRRREHRGVPRTRLRFAKPSWPQV